MTGLLIPPEDPRALADAIAHLAEDPALREQMGRAGRHRAKELFSVARYCQTITAAYNEL